MCINFSSVRFLSVFVTLIIMCNIICFTACDWVKEQPDANMLRCVAVYRSTTTSSDSVFFTEENIQYFDTTTNELKIKTGYNLDKMLRFSYYVFYLQTDSLFSAQPVSELMSSTRSDLVIRFSLLNNKIYLEDGYPMYIDNLGYTSQISENKAKRATNWKRFLNRLKVIGKLR